MGCSSRFPKRRRPNLTPQLCLLFVCGVHRQQDVANCPCARRLPSNEAPSIVSSASGRPYVRCFNFFATAGMPGHGRRRASAVVLMIATAAAASAASAPNDITAAAAGQPASPTCQRVLDLWCSGLQTCSEEIKAAGQQLPLIARYGLNPSRPPSGAEWRCYTPSVLDASRSRCKTAGCDGAFCSHPDELATVLPIDDDVAEAALVGDFATDTNPTTIVKRMISDHAEQHFDDENAAPLLFSTVAAALVERFEYTNLLYYHHCTLVETRINSLNQLDTIRRNMDSATLG